MMKTELTLDNKAKFYGAHWGCKIVYIGDGEPIKGIGKEMSLTYDSADKFHELLFSSQRSVLLKSLSSITDEDAIEIAVVAGINRDDILKIEEADEQSIVDRSDEFGLRISVKYWYESLGETTEWELRDFTIYCPTGDVSDSYGCSNNIAFVIDYLRSKGYALPWMGLSVDEMVKAGWIKLVDISND